MRGSLRHFLQYQNQHSNAQHAQPSARFPKVDDGKIDRKPTKIRVKPMALARFYPKFIHWIVLRSPACIQPANPFHHVFFTSWNWFKPNQLIRILRSKKSFQKNCQWTMRRLSSINCVSYTCIYMIWYIITNNHIWLVVSTPLKNVSSSVGMIIPNIWKNITCSKPPTRYGIWHIYTPYICGNLSDEFRSTYTVGVPTSSLMSPGVWVRPWTSGLRPLFGRFKATKRGENLHSTWQNLLLGWIYMSIYSIWL